MVKALIIENVRSRRYNLVIDEKIEDGKRVLYLIVQDRASLNRRAIFSGPEATALYRHLKRYAKSGKTPQYETECKKLISTQMGDAVPEAPVKPIEVPVVIPKSNDIWVMEYPGTFTSEQYGRLRDSLDTAWPAHLPRPILLEGGLILKKMSI